MGKGINKALKKAGKNVSYKEAAKIAEKAGVSVDRVYSNAQSNGQGTRAGAAASTAGYTPPSSVTRAPSFVGTESPGNSPGVIGSNPGVQPGDGQNGDGQSAFDWDAWNLQMQEQQAAVWASMDAMNAQFLQQQEEWRASQETKYGPWIQGRRQVINGLNNSDQAQVKRKKKKKPATTAAGTKLSIGGANAAGGVSTGGQGAGKTLGIS